MLARSRWTSADDENAPIDAVARRTIRTAAVVPPWIARRRASSGDQAAAATGEPAQQAERQRDEPDRGQPGGDPGQRGDGRDQRVGAGERAGAARAADAALAEQVRPDGGEDDHDEVEDEPPGRHAARARVVLAGRRGLPRSVPGSAVAIRSPTATAATRVAATIVARLLPAGIRTIDRRIATPERRDRDDAALEDDRPDDLAERRRRGRGRGPARAGAGGR